MQIKTEKILNAPGDHADMVARYFLRRLAMANRKSHVSPSKQFHEALVETVLVFLGFPAAATLSFVGLSTMKWWNPVVEKNWPWVSIWMIGLAIWVPVLVIGHRWISRRFGNYRSHVSARYLFDSERDRRIASWQKTLVFMFCGVVMPWLGILCGRLFS